MIEVHSKRFVFVAVTSVAALLCPATALAGTITVNTGTDSANSATNCSLREAVGVAANDANANGCTDSGGGLNDTITFASTGVDPVLTIAPAGDPDDNLTGDLDVEAVPATNGTLTILGLGQTSTTIEGGVGAALGPDRLFDHESGTLSFKDLTLTDGNSTGAEDGGAIRSISAANTDVLSLTDVAIDGNLSGGNGGGVSYSQGTLSVLRSTFSGNEAGVNGGGISTSSGTVVNVTQSSFDQNSATGTPGLGGGLAVSGVGVTFNLTDSTVTGNDTGIPNAGNRAGGLLFSATGAPGTVTGATISGNETDGGFGGGVAIEGGTLNVSSSSIAGNHASVGAGVSASNPFNLSGSSVTGNIATSSPVLPVGVGGGIHNLVDSTVTNSTISGNSAVNGAAGTSQLQGAGISNGNNDMRVVGSTISGNFFTTADPSISFGAALTSTGGSNVDLINSTVAGNDESGIGGPIYGFGGGTAIVDIIGSTVAGNTFAAGQHSINFGGAGSVVRLRGSVLGDPAACGLGVTAAMATYNVDAGSTCPVGTGSVSNADALLGPLAANGGGTQTRLIAAGSPAVDRLPAAVCTDDLGAPLATDQRGLPRPSPTGGACDAGAVEITKAPLGAKKCKKAKKKKKKKRSAEPAAAKKKKKKKKKCKKKKKK